MKATGAARTRGHPDARAAMRPGTNFSPKPKSANSESAIPYGIVYVRVPRSDRIIHLTAHEAIRKSKEGEPFDPSFTDTLPEVSRILGGFNAPGQLVWRHPDGTQTIIFDCVNGMPNEGVKTPQKDGDDVCVPADPHISFDGTKVAFAVYHGKGSDDRDPRDLMSGEVWKLKTPTWAGIYIYNFKTGQLTHWPHKVGVWDTAPIWLPGNKMAFTSTRSNVYARHSVYNQSHRPILQLWIANRDGSDAHNIGTQAQDDVLHPIVDSTGRIVFSIHEVPWARYWDRTGFCCGSATVDNIWWVESVDLRGGNLMAHLGAHNFLDKPFYYQGKRIFGSVIEATHFLAELSNGDLCTDEYYRGNNMGAGRVDCWTPRGAIRKPLGHEGPYPFGDPKGLHIALNGAHLDEFGSKVRDPAGVPGNKILFARAPGTCYFTRDFQKIVAYTRKTLAGKPGNTCDFGIYEKTPLPLGWNLQADKSNYDQAVEIVNSPKWHEFMPKAVLPYKAIYGIEEPRQPPEANTGDSDKSYGIFASVDANKANLRTQHGWNGPKDGRWCHFQGCALQAPAFLTHKDGDDFDTMHQMKYIRFWRVIPLKKPKAPLSWRQGHTLADVWGQKLVLMGDVPIQPDGSFKAKLPANVPFLMAGVDAQGRSIARHQQVMALRPGEKQVCSGCHLHAPPGNAETRLRQFAQTKAASKPAVAPQILFSNENPAPEWKADIYPMLKQHCGTCHDGSRGAPKPNFTESRRQLYEDLTNYDGTDGNSVYPVAHPALPGGAKAAAPWLTRWINPLFARQSLLYWKAAGKRMDGRTDATRDDDFNFGKPHPSDLTVEDMRMLSDWIEEGLYCDTDKERCGTDKRQ